MYRHVPTALAVANEFIKRGLADNQPVDPLKLQKLLYFAQGWHLALFNRPLFGEEIEAWRYGPVVRSVYHKFKRYGSSKIRRPGTRVRRDGSIGCPRVRESHARTHEFLNQLWEQHKNLSGLQLAAASHAPGTPWYETVQEEKEKWEFLPQGTDIPLDRIREHFLRLARSGN